jgi:hypothetical protein
MLYGATLLGVLSLWRTLARPLYASGCPTDRGQLLRLTASLRPLRGEGAGEWSPPMSGRS